VHLVVVEDSEGLTVWPADRIAALTPAYPNRWRAVSCEGSVGYCPSFPEGGPWVPCGPSWVHPAWLRRQGEGWLDPAGFFHPGGQLPPVPDPQPPDPRWALEVGGWCTDDGLCPHAGSLEEVAAEEAGLARVGTRSYVRLSRVRRLRIDETRLTLELDNGPQRGVSPRFLPTLLAALNLEDPRHLHPYVPALFNLKLREYPVELAMAPAAYLKAHFSQVRILVANLIWQGVFYHSQGIENEYGRDHQGYFYLPVSSPLSRIGFMRSKDPLDKKRAEDLFQRILGEMVGDHRLFTFTQLGFEDTGEARREIGSLHPRIVLLVEKKGLWKRARTLARRYGISLLLTGGVPNLVEVEFFLRALGGSEPVTIVAYVDWDPGGFWVAQTLANHCLRYNVPSLSAPHFLVRPERFSADELELISRGLDDLDPRVINWVKATGGTGGQARGFYAEWWRPFSRVEAAMEELMRELGVGPVRRRRSYSTPSSIAPNLSNTRS